MNLFSKLRERESSGKPLRVGLIGAGKFGSMYLAQVPRVPGIHLAAIVDLSPANAQANLARVGWPKEKFSASSLDDAIEERTNACRRRLASAGGASGYRDHHRMHRQSARGGGACAGGLPSRQASHQRHRRGRRLLRAAARTKGARGRRDLQPRLWRSARPGLRTRRLGAHGRISGGRRRPRPQMAAALPRVDAGHRVDPLGTDRRAGEGRRAQSKNVQRVPRRVETRDRERGDRQRHRPRGAGSTA